MIVSELHECAGHSVDPGVPYELWSGSSTQLGLRANRYH